MIEVLLSSCQCLLLSIRLSAPAIRKLLSQTGTVSIIVSSRTEGHVNHALRNGEHSEAAHVLVTESVPFDQFLQSCPPRKEFPYLAQCKSFVREDDQNVLILHSSGTTGKLIRLVDTCWSLCIV